MSTEPTIEPEPDDKPWTWQERQYVGRLARALGETEEELREWFAAQHWGPPQFTDQLFHTWITGGVWSAFANGHGPDPRQEAPDEKA